MKYEVKFTNQFKRDVKLAKKRTIIIDTGNEGN
jgi:mRNA-degrading endonuclease YafQ of YafQ-DinJ toxin-antitoxin module